MVPIPARVNQGVAHMSKGLERGVGFAGFKDWDSGVWVWASGFRV